MSCPFCRRTDTDGLLSDDDHCRELKATVPPPRAVRYNFALDSATYKRLGKARQGKDSIPGRRIA